MLRAAILQIEPRCGALDVSLRSAIVVPSGGIALKSITISVEVPDDLPSATAQQIRDDAWRAAIYRVAHERKVPFPEAAHALGFPKAEADRLIEGMDWFEDPLAPVVLGPRFHEGMEEQERGASRSWNEVRGELGL